MKKLNSLLFSYGSMSVLFAIFGIAMAYATFIENDYDTITAKALVYNSWYFSILLVLIVIQLIGSLIHYKVFKLKKWSILLFHLAFIGIFLGSAMTRYYSFEGLMHIREGNSSNKISSSDYYLQIKAKGESEKEKVVGFDDKILLSPYVYVNYKSQFKIDNEQVNINAVDYIAKASEAAVSKENGYKVLTLFISDTTNANNRVLLKAGEKFKYNNFSVGFDTDEDTDLNFKSSGDVVLAEPNSDFEYINMFKQSEKKNLKKGDTINNLNIYFSKKGSVIFKSYNPKAEIKAVQLKNNMNGHQADKNALILDVNYKGIDKRIILLTDNNSGKGDVKFFEIDGTEFIAKYGRKNIILPFNVHLEDFILEKYVGSMSPSSFKSKVRIENAETGDDFKYEIFMNNILDYHGYRFFQSSYDKDEKGTILSVNYDFWGTTVTYIAYFLMTLGITFSLFNKKSRLHTLLKKSASSSLKSILALILLGISSSLWAQNISITDQKPNFDNISKELNNHSNTFRSPNQIDEKVADEFSKLLVVDLKGRLKPLNTLASEIFRKVSRSSTIEGFSPSQVLMDMMIYPENWKNANLVVIKSEKLKSYLNSEQNKYSFNQISNCFEGNENVVLKYAQLANDKKASDRDAFDKEILKINERMNILALIFNGEIFNIFPDNSCEDCPWVSFTQAKFNSTPEVQKLADSFVDHYKLNANSKNSENTLNAVKSISDFQKKFSHRELPSSSRIAAEIIYNKLNLFPKLAIGYFLFGLSLLIISFVKLLNETKALDKIEKLLKWGVNLFFIFHFSFFILRWYIAGYAPMSNGYETILFIALITVLTGILLHKRSQITYAVSAVLASVLMLVASLSYFDPEITNQAPVLKSVWLVIHVAVITMSYGFFGIAALLGLFNISIFSALNFKNKAKLLVTAEELVDIIEITLIIGLYLLTIGTFLGAVWANESWERYWGWDPKETWALITILVYSIYVHMKQTKYFQGLFRTSFWAVLCFSSVLMTYFGVNYFLSGLHSYAGDGPSNIPTWVYYAIFGLFTLSGFSYFNYRKINK